MSEQKVHVVEPKPRAGGTQIDPAPSDLYRSGRRDAFLRVALAGHTNIVAADGTQAGKTSAGSELIEEGAGAPRMVSSENVGEVFLRKRGTGI